MGNSFFYLFSHSDLCSPRLPSDRFSRGVGRWQECVFETRQRTVSPFHASALFSRLFLRFPILLSVPAGCSFPDAQETAAITSAVQEAVGSNRNTKFKKKDDSLDS